MRTIRSLVMAGGIAVLGLVLCPAGPMLAGEAQAQSQADRQEQPQRRPPAEPGYDIAAMFKTHYNPISAEFLTGAQPTPEILKNLRDEKGIKVVINLRPPQEFNAEEVQQAAKRLGLRYFNIPVAYRNPQPEQVDEFLKITDDPANRPALIYCAMNIRAGAFFAIRRVLRDGWTFEDAAQEAAKGAPIAPHLRAFALAYIEERQKK